MKGINPAYERNKTVWALGVYICYNLQTTKYFQKYLINPIIILDDNSIKFHSQIILCERPYFVQPYVK